MVRFLYTNTDNSPLSKLDELKVRLTTDPRDIICITEIKPKIGTIPDETLLQINGYDLHVNKTYMYNDTRGTAMYTKKELKATVVDNNISTEFKDALWINIPGPCNDNLLVGCIYRSGSPNKAVQLDQKLHAMMKHMAIDVGYKQVMMIGDFNHPNILWTPEPIIQTKSQNENHPDVKFVDLIHDSMLHQHISEPTRDRDNQTPTVHDLIFTTDHDIIEDLQHCSHIGASDHQCLQFTVNYSTCKSKPIQQTRLKYAKADFNKLEEMLDIDWTTELHRKSTDQSYGIFLDIIISIMQRVKNVFPRRK